MQSGKQTMHEYTLTKSLCLQFHNEAVKHFNIDIAYINTNIIKFRKEHSEKFTQTKGSTDVALVYIHIQKNACAKKKTVLKTRYLSVKKFLFNKLALKN